MAMGVNLNHINVTERHYNNPNLTFVNQNELEPNDEHVEFNCIIGIQKLYYCTKYCFNWLTETICL